MAVFFFSFLEQWSRAAIFERAEKRLAACRFSLEQKNKGLAVFILEQKIGIAGAVFLEQKTEAAWLDLYADWVRSSSTCFLI